MAFRIKRNDRSVEAAVRRIADEQLARALSELNSETLAFDEKIHQVRKRCKKLRGLVRLVRPAFDDYKRENRGFRDAARLLSGIRDAHTLIETYDAVATHYDEQVERRAFASIRARLTRDARSAGRDFPLEERMETCRDMLKAARERAAGWRIEEDGFDPIAGGAGKTYKRARKHLQRACEETSDDAMHEWRKRIKYHWYHARLLSACAPSMMGAHAQAADELSDLLGDHHDLAVLASRLSHDPGGFGSSDDTDAFLALVVRRKDELAREALGRGKVLLAERPKDIKVRWRTYWESWRDGADGKDLILS